MRPAPILSKLNGLTPSDLQPLQGLIDRYTRRAQVSEERGEGVAGGKKAALVRRVAEALSQGTNGFRSDNGKYAGIVSRNNHSNRDVAPWQVTVCWLDAEGKIEAMEYDMRSATLAEAVLDLVSVNLVIPQERFELSLSVWPTNVNDEEDKAEQIASSVYDLDGGYFHGSNLGQTDTTRDRIAKAGQGQSGGRSEGASEGLRADEEAGPLKSSRFRNALATPGPIESLTIPELRAAEDPAFLKKGVRRAELTAPMLKRVYASTVEYQTKSSKYIKNKTIYTQKVLFRDFYYIAKDKQIPLRDAIRYALESGDVHFRCQCPSFLYHGWAYIGTELGALYGLPREGRFPEQRNPALKSVYCKHLSRVMEQIIKNEESIVEKFAAVYNRSDLPGIPKDQNAPEKQPQPRETTTEPNEPAPEPVDLSSDEEEVTLGV